MEIILHRIKKSEGLVQLYLGTLLGIALDLPHHPKPSLRAMARSKEGLNLEGLRSKLRKLAEREEEIMAELARIFTGGDEDTGCLSETRVECKETLARSLIREGMECVR